MKEARDLLAGLVDYIGEQAKDIDPRAYRLMDSKGFLRERKEIASLPGVNFDLHIEGDHIWLRVERLAADQPPRPLEKIRNFLRISDSPDGPPPAVDETAINRWLTRKAKDKTCEERSSLEGKARRYLARELEAYTSIWKAWAEGEGPRRKTIELYGDLFALKRQIEAEETANPQEFVWGIGISSWRLSYKDDPVVFKYPLLTQTLEISLDVQTMAIDVRPRETETRVQMEAFITCQVPGAAEVERSVREHLSDNRDRPVTPFDASSYTHVLKLAVRNLDRAGEYSEVMIKEEPVPSPGDHLVVTDAWVIFSRPRQNHFLFDDLNRLKNELRGGCEIASGPLALVTPPSDKPIEFEPVRFRGISGRGNFGKGQVQELFFPHPYNEEQVTIVQLLERVAGVAVQGPPGTGKTHTIANIICHYLAEGRRVLVTSRGEPALEVLQSKIPEEVRPLTVALLAGDREGTRQFQASIGAIQHRLSQLNPDQTRNQIETLKSKIDRAHSELASIDNEIDKIAIAQLSEVEIDGSANRAQDLADLVISGREIHGWFDDALSLCREQAPPLSEDEAGRLREARRRLGSDLIYAQAQVPSADELPETSAVAELHGSLVRMRTIDDQVSSGELPSLKSATLEILQAVRYLLAEVEKAKSLVEHLESFEDRWPLELRVKCRQPSFASECKALESLLLDLKELSEAHVKFLQRPVEFPEAGLASSKTKKAVSRGADQGKPFRFLAIGNREAKKHVDAVRVEGLPPAGVDDWAHVQSYVSLNDRVLSFVYRWNVLAKELPLPELAGDVASLKRILLAANTAKSAHMLATCYDSVLPKKAEAVFDKALSEDLAGTAADLSAVRDHLLRHLTKAELFRASTQLTGLQEKLASKTGPVSDALREFAERDLGNPSLPPEQVTARYVNIVAELRRISGLAVELSLVRDLSKRIEKAGAPKLAERVRCEVVENAGEDNAFPATWRQAWNWARISSYLDSIEARDQLLDLFARRRNLENRITSFYRDMVANAAWLATKNKATPTVLSALQGYATAIGRIGQGTGPNATRYRRDARQAMLNAAGAVPCWIMSHARVSESMPAEIGAFDLVIVDEASQSDLWALPAILRGKKILVVGDDKQVSPDPGFIAAQRIQELRDRFLADQPFGTEMTPEKSLYDLAAQVFAAQQVILREHFRCVPPIIAYSNRVFYKGAIRPLRIPRSSERIDPPLVDIYVPDGTRNRRDCNEYEAHVIAEEIAALLKDDRFAERSLGVVSLLGMEQAKYIDSLVRQRCEDGALLRRRFECGDARTFQGSERDIMFLSLVVDGQNCRALSGNLFDQRFNVAGSRARDRMYLVRSVKASELSDKDLRLTLLSHFENPLVPDEVDSESLIDRCESGFERSVYFELTSRGFRVIPQVRTGAYRIDMVVEGAGDARLAIECDGDEFHGPDRWQHDVSRQRVLERAGWEFWRCFASTWSLRKDEVLAELLDRLARKGVEPLGALGRVPTLVEKREWHPKETENGSVD
jgi:very-short-patch-repair endonuclease